MHRGTVKELMKENVGDVLSKVDMTVFDLVGLKHKVGEFAMSACNAKK